MSRSGRIATGAALAGAALAGAALAARVLDVVRPLGRLPLWDEAGNLWGAGELVAALAGGRWLDFLVRLNGQDKWPFGFSLLLAPFVATGADRAGAAWLPALAFAATAPLLVWAGREAADGLRGTAAGVLAAALWLASPIALALATVVLRETVGAALGVAVLAAWLRARRLGTLPAWRLVGVLLLALAWVKYNYFLMSATALALHALLELDPAKRRAAVARVRAAVAGSGWRAPARWLAVLAVASVLLLATGRNPGNLLYGALVIATGVPVVRAARGRWSPRRWLAGLTAPARGLSECLVAPLWLWCLSPSPIHPRAIFSFLRNREGHAPAGSVESLLFYPRALWREGFPGGLEGGCALALAAAGLWLLGRRGEPARAVAATAVVALAALELHPLKEARFLVTALPALALLAGLALARVAAGRSSERGRLVSGAVLILGVAAAVLGSMRSVAIDFAAGRPARDHRLLTGEPAWRRPLDDVVARVASPAPPPTALLGGLNELSESLVRWQAWRATGREATLIGPLRGLGDGADRARVAAELARWLERERPRRIVALRPLAGSAVAVSSDYRRFNAWQLEAWRALAGDRRWRRHDARTYRDAGVVVATWRRRGAGAPRRHRLRGRRAA